MTMKSIDELSERGDSYTEYPTYIRHWEEATDNGWKIKILTENGLHILIVNGKRISDHGT